MFFGISIPSEQFNLVEGIFWIILGMGAAVFYYYCSTKYKKISAFTAFILITFGISDFFQVVYGSFLVPGMEWLLIWKVIDVIGLFTIFTWYLILRIKY